MRSALLVLLALSADAALDSSAATLAAATNTVTIGSGTSYWSAMPSNPSSYSLAVGDKLRFQYNSYHNLYLMESAAKIRYLIYLSAAKYDCPPVSLLEKGEG